MVQDRRLTGREPARSFNRPLSLAENGVLADLPLIKVSDKDVMHKQRRRRGIGHRYRSNRQDLLRPPNYVEETSIFFFFVFVGAKSRVFGGFPLK